MSESERKAYYEKYKKHMEAQEAEAKTAEQKGQAKKAAEKPPLLRRRIRRRTSESSLSSSALWGRLCAAPTSITTTLASRFVGSFACPGSEIDPLSATQRAFTRSCLASAATSRGCAGTVNTWSFKGQGDPVTLSGLDRHLAQLRVSARRRPEDLDVGHQQRRVEGLVTSAGLQPRADEAGRQGQKGDPPARRRGALS